MQCRLAAGKVHNVRLAFVTHDRIQHFLDQRKRAVFRALRPAAGVAHGAAQVARVRKLHQGQAGMLFVVGAQSTIIWTAPLYRRVVNLRHLRWLEKHLATTPVVIHIIGHEDAFCAVFRTAFKQKHFVVLKDDFSFELAKTVRADRHRDVIKQVRPDTLRHVLHLLL